MWALGSPLSYFVINPRDVVRIFATPAAHDPSRRGMLLFDSHVYENANGGHLVSQVPQYSRCLRVAGSLATYGHNTMSKLHILSHMQLGFFLTGSGGETKNKIVLVSKSSLFSLTR